MPNDITDAAARSAKARKTLDRMRGRAPRARRPGRGRRDRGRGRPWDALAIACGVQHGECMSNASHRIPQACGRDGRHTQGEA